MRNEIYNKIRQNKIQYYAELKKQGLNPQSEISTEKSDNSSPTTQKLNPGNKKKKIESSKIENNVRKINSCAMAGIKELTEKVKSKDFQEIPRNIFPAIKKTGIIISQFLVAFWWYLKSGYFSVMNSRFMKGAQARVENSKNAIQTAGEKINIKIDHQTEKIAFGIYNMSAGLFEEREEQPDLNKYFDTNNSLLTNNENSVEWDLTDYVQPQSSLNDRIGLYSALSASWVKNLHERIVKYFTTDLNPETERMNLAGMK